MEILNGKARIDFNEWIKDKAPNFKPKDYALNTAKLISYTLIQDWLRSNKIWVECNSLKGEYYWCEVSCFYNKKSKTFLIPDSDSDLYFTDYHEGLKSGLTKAIELYNSKTT